MEDENGAREANRGIRDCAQSNTGSDPDAGDTIDESGAGLEIDDPTTSRPNVRWQLPAKQFKTEPIVGWRAWRLVSWKLLIRREVELESIFYPMIWQPARPVRALVALEVPSGVHAWQTRAQCVRHSKLYGVYSRDWIPGEVSLWGHVIKHEHGYRAEFAYPRSLVVPECLRVHGDIAGDLRRTYGVECEWLPSKSRP